MLRLAITFRLTDVDEIIIDFKAQKPFSDEIGEEIILNGKFIGWGERKNIFFLSAITYRGSALIVNV